MKYYKVIHVYDCINVRDDDYGDKYKEEIGRFATREEAEFIVDKFSHKETYCETETWYSDDPVKFTWGKLIIEEGDFQLKKVDDIKDRWWIEYLKDSNPSYAEEPIRRFF